MIKAVFFDIDGTIYSHTTGDMPQSTKIAIKKLKEKGIQCVIATGRNLPDMKGIPVNDIEFDGYITMNGQLCLDKNKDIIYSNPIDKEDEQFILELFKKKQLPVVLVDKDDMYINYIDDTVTYVKNDVSTPVPIVMEYQEKYIYLASIFTFNNVDKWFEEHMKTCKVFRWHPGSIDIYSRNSDKVEGIKRYLALNNLTREEIMVFGDGENDVEMIAYAGIGIAMGNAHEDAKKACDYVTDHIDENGVYKALKYYKIID